MAAICGISNVHGGGGRGPKAIGLMQAELPGDGPVGSVCAEGQVRFGCRDAAASMCVDRAAGVWLAADARIDDRDALCDALRVPAADRGEVVDAELILRAWLRWGQGCPGRLLGDYAFAVWDARRGTLLR